MNYLRTVFFAIVFFSTLLAGTAFATARAEIPAQHFSGLPLIFDPELSPDGSMIAFFERRDGNTQIVMRRLDQSAGKVVIPSDNGARFAWLHWVSNERLIFAVSFSGASRGSRFSGTRLFSVNTLGQDLTPIIKPGKRMVSGSLIQRNLSHPQLQHEVIDWHAGDSDHILVVVDEDNDDEGEVRRVNVNSGKYEIVRKSDADIQHWVANASGHVRMGYGFTKTRFIAKVKGDSGYWIDAHETDWWKRGYRPLAFTDDANVMYMRGPNKQGMNTVRTMRVSDGKFTGTIFEHQNYDADGLIYDPVSRRPVGVKYTDHHRRERYFQPGFSRLQEAAEAVLSNRIVHIVSTSADRRQLVLRASTNTDPGAYWLWNTESNKTTLLASLMPQLNTAQLSTPQPVSFVARDGATIPAYLTLPKGMRAQSLPTIVVPHGGPNERSDADFSYLTQFLASRGYAVFQPNFRGSDGYGKPFREAGNNQWGGLMQDDITDGANWLVATGVADPGRMCIAGFSYGGYAAAMAAIKTGQLFKCAISINAVLDLPRLVSKERQFIGGRVRVKTIGLAGASLKTVSPFHQAEKINIPMLLVQTQDDVRVGRGQAERMYKRLRKLDKVVEYLKVDRGGHTINNASARLLVLKNIEQFLAKHVAVKSERTDVLPQDAAPTIHDAVSANAIN